MARIFSYTIFALLFITQLQLCMSEPLTLIAIGVISGVMGIIDFIWGKVDRINEVPSGESETLSINDLKNQLNLMTAEIIKAVNDANKVQTLKDRIHDAAQNMAQIDNFYKDMKYYNTSTKDRKSKKTQDEAHMRLLNGRDGPEFYLHRLHNLFYSEVDENIFQLIDGLKQNYAGTCLTGSNLETVQQIYQKLYTWSAIAAAKTYITILIASQLTENFYGDVTYTKSKIIKLDNRAIVVLKQYARTASREVWRCDPDEYIEDVTYIKLKGLFQKYIIQEHDLGSYFNDCSGTCSSGENPTTTDRCNSESHTYSVVYPYLYQPALLCSIEKTCEELWDCEYFPVTFRAISKNDYLYICNSEKGSDRRYDYLKKTYGDGGKQIDEWGRKENCKNFTSWASPHGSGMYKCDVCMCTCAESDVENSDAYISLEAVYSDVQNNRVVTGARFVKKHNTIHIEIEEGTLGKIATIVNNSASWVTQEYFKPTEQDVVSGRVHKFYWTVGREINLHDVHAPEGEVIVGLRVLYHGKFGVYLSIFTKPFDFETGTLSGRYSRIRLPVSLSEEKLNLDDCDVPTLAPRKSGRSETNKIVTVTTTGMKEDIGQNVIPFWDTQNVTTTIRAPMSGIGIYYKTFQNYGGFLGLKLFTYDIEPHIKDHPEDTESISYEAMY